MPQASTFNKQRGFTLIETLIVLFIFIAVTGIVMVSFQSVRVEKQTQYFFEQLQKDLYLSQEYALAHHKEVDLTFLPMENRYSVRSGSIVLFTRPYDPKMNIKSNFGMTVQFNPNGNIAKFGTLTVSSPSGGFKVVFHIGKGRFYVEKL